MAWRRFRFRGLITQDNAFEALAFSAALGLIAILALLVRELIGGSMPAFERFGFGFLTEATWDPVREVFGVVTFVYGTVISSVLALAIAVPLSLGVAIYLSELAPEPVGRALSFIVEILAFIPSVIYGLWGMYVLAPIIRDVAAPILSTLFGFLPLFKGPISGLSMLTGGVILAIMATPIISSMSREVLKAVPEAQREAAYALGAMRWEVIRFAVLPYARPGLIGAITLGLGRALGETMAVTMVIGNRPEISLSLFAPAYTMAAVIANEFAEATSDLYVSALVEVGLILFALSLTVNILARLMVWRFLRARRGAAV